MSDETPAMAGTPPASPSQPPQPSPTINIGDEFGTAKRNLPPAKIVLIAIAGVLVIVGVASFLKRATPQAAGSLDHVAAIEIPGQGSTMAAITFTLKNTGAKILYVRSIQGKAVTASGEFTAEAVSAIDFDRYFQAFPALKEGSQPALPPETQLQPGEQVVRTAIMVFAVPLEAFNQRKSLSVIIQPYDQQVPIVLTK
jgi:hypothetical protein